MRISIYPGKTCLLFLLIPLFVFAAVDVQAQYRKNDEFHAGHQKYDDPARKSPNRAAEVTFGSGHATVEWSAPSVRDRDLYGQLIPAGRVWRSGANEATVIHFDDDVLVEGKALKAGSYALFTIGSAEEWTIIFNSVSQTWGAFSHDPDDDALRVTVAPAMSEHQEELLFSFEGTTESATTVQLRWGPIAVGFGVELAD